MKTIFTLLIIGLNGFMAAGQCCPYINSVTIDPANPSASDNIRIFTTVTPPNAGGLISHSFTVQNDTIFAEACYWSGMLTVLIPIHDTIEVGPLPEGDYVLQFTAKQSAQMEQCIVEDSEVYHMNFSIGSTAGIVDPEQALINLYPNPVTEWLHIAGNDLLAARLLNMDGKVIAAPITLASSELLHIDMSALAKGCYFVEVQTGSAVVRERIVKQ